MRQRVIKWLPSLFPAVGVAIFAGTVLPYLSSRGGSPIGWVPLLVGALVFAGLVGGATYLVRGPAGKWWQIALAVAVSVGAFVYAFFFVVLNTVGA